MKKRIIAIIGFLVLLAGLVAGIYLLKQQQDIREKAAPATSVSITPKTSTAMVGEQVKLSVEVDTQTNELVVAILDISFDAGKLTLEKVVPQTFLPIPETPPQIDNTSGIAYVTFKAQPGNIPQGKGILAVLEFKAKSPGTASIAFRDQTIGKAAYEYNVPGERKTGYANAVVNKIPATVTILAPSAPPSVAPSPTPDATSTPAASPTPTVTSTPTSSPAASSTPRATSTPGTGGNTQTTPTPSSSPIPSGSPGGSGNKPTVNFPASKTVKAGDTITGTAKASSMVTIKIQSETITATVKADASGKWSYKIPSTLEAGSHTITVTDASGASYTSTFIIASANQPTSETGNLPDAGVSLPSIIGLAVGVLLLALGAILAF